jgi:hypothetical protein
VRRVLLRKLAPFAARGAAGAADGAPVETGASDDAERDDARTPPPADPLPTGK